MSEIINAANGLIDFIEKSPSAFHAVKNIADKLTENGFFRLEETEKWELAEGGKYFVTKNSTSIIAFEVGEDGAPFMICASHSDSPSFRVKEENVGAYVRLNVERYGGMIMYSWFDRPLSLAGRVILKTENGIEERLFNVDRDLLVIPSVAIHFSRGVNEGFAPNPAVDLLPLISNDKSFTLRKLIAEELSVSESDVLAHDLFLYARERGRLLGANGEFILSPRIDDLECVYTSLEAFLASDKTSATKVLAVFDNEEVGSSTKQGANSTFMQDTLERIAGSRESCVRALVSSFMVSADNAHAKHPAHPELSDAANAPILGGGVVIKHNANQRYTTDALSDAIFTLVCERCGVKLQHYYNRADVMGGSTLGSIANTKVSVPSIDIGLAQLAMHSAVETAATEDVLEMQKALTEFYNTTLSSCSTKTVVK